MPGSKALGTGSGAVVVPPAPQKAGECGGGYLGSGNGKEHTMLRFLVASLFWIFTGGCPPVDSD